MTDFRREKDIKGKEELIAVKYDPQGNVISRKKADDIDLNNVNVISDGNGGYVDESVMRTNSRQELDAQGTIQSFNREFMDALGGSGPHDGHYGPGGPADGSHDAATGGTKHGRGA